MELNIFRFTNCRINLFNLFIWFTLLKLSTLAFVRFWFNFFSLRSRVKSSFRTSLISIILLSLISCFTCSGLPFLTSTFLLNFDFFFFFFNLLVWLIFYWLLMTFLFAFNIFKNFRLWRLNIFLFSVAFSFFMLEEAFGKCALVLPLKNNIY